MDNLTWLVVCWALIAGLCYYFVTLGRGKPRPVQSATEPLIPNVNNKNSTEAVAVPSTDWLNEIVSWLWTNNGFPPEMASILIRALNDAAKKFPNEQNEILFEEGSVENDRAPFPAPRLLKVYANQGPKGHLTMRTDLHIPLIGVRLVTSQRTHSRVVVANLDAVVSDLRGEVELRLAQIADEIYLMGCFTGHPSMSITTVNRESNVMDDELNTILVEDLIRKCILSCVVNFNLNECVPQSKGIYGEEQFNNGNAVNNMVRYLHQTRKTPRPDSSSIPNKLEINVVRAQRLGDTEEVYRPYVTIEMDEPAQKFTTNQSLNNRPYWEEPFDFTLSPASDEVLFEIYDSGSEVDPLVEPKFLGLAIVGLAELRQSAEPVHHLRLQGRPYKDDNVSGVLTIQCRFYHDPSVPLIGKEVENISLQTSDGMRLSETNVNDRRFIYDPHEIAESFSPIPTKTTTSYKQQQMNEQQPPTGTHQFTYEHEANPSASPNEWQSTLSKTEEVTPSSVNEGQDGFQEYFDQKVQPSTATQQRYSYDHTAHEEVLDSERQPRDRERRKQSGEKRERSFFGELRERLRGRSRSKQRARSLDEQNPVLEEAVSLPPSRDVSQTRQRPASRVPPQRQFAESLSIGDSTGYQANGTPSTLVLELGKSGEAKKYYLIPPAVATEPAALKLMRRGKKLHLHNNHSFVAVKPSGRVMCNVCGKRISSTFMKQAYQCRDCHIVSHKNCHQRTPSPCPQSKHANLNIIKDVDWVQFLSQHQVGEFISRDGL